MANVSISLSNDVFERLQRLAVPLVDDINSVIVRLLDAREQAASRPSDQAASVQSPAKSSVCPGPAKVEKEFWPTSRGLRLPVGHTLRGYYKGEVFEAKVCWNGIEYKGQLFRSPSRAAITAKEVAGTDSEAASTNGLTFWHIDYPIPGNWIPIRQLKQAP